LRRKKVKIALRQLKRRREGGVSLLSDAKKRRIKGVLPALRGSEEPTGGGVDTEHAPKKRKPPHSPGGKESFI